MMLLVLYLKLLYINYTFGETMAVYVRNFINNLMTNFRKIYECKNRFEGLALKLRSSCNKGKALSIMNLLLTLTH